jgi:hypothetical protein
MSVLGKLLEQENVETFRKAFLIIFKIISLRFYVLIFNLLVPLP